MRRGDLPPAVCAATRPSPPSSGSLFRRQSQSSSSVRLQSIVDPTSIEQLDRRCPVGFHHLRVRSLRDEYLPEPFRVSRGLNVRGRGDVLLVLCGCHLVQPLRVGLAHDAPSAVDADPAGVHRVYKRCSSARARCCPCRHEVLRLLRPAGVRHPKRQRPNAVRGKSADLGGAIPDASVLRRPSAYSSSRLKPYSVGDAGRVNVPLHILPGVRRACLAFAAHAVSPLTPIPTTCRRRRLATLGQEYTSWCAGPSSWACPQMNARTGPGHHS